MIETIATYIYAALPALTSIIGVVAACLKIKNNNKQTFNEVLGQIESVRQQVEDTTEYTELKAQLLAMAEENTKLKQKINELLTKIDHIAREEE